MSNVTPARASPPPPFALSARLAASQPYSWRTDPAIPRFNDGAPLIVYDGVCVLCSHTMARIARADTRHQFRFASAQSALGQALFRHYGLDPVAFDTVLLLADGRAFGKLDVVFEVARRLGGVWRLLGLAKALPRALQDRAYDLVARNRYRVFGRRDLCMIPDPSWRDRVIDLLPE